MTVVRLQKEITIFLVLFFGVTLFLFWLMNGGAYAKNLKYEIFLNSPLVESGLKNTSILEISKTSDAGIGLSSSGGLALFIPAIEVASPIILPKTDRIKDILVSLEDGVGLYPGSAAPGHTGRGVILGHSSRASWYRGDYATIFALLGKLKTGDQFIITDEGKRYTYTIFSKEFLTPQQTNAVLAGPANGSEIDLITCYPIGSASKRTLVRAVLSATETTSKK